MEKDKFTETLTKTIQALSVLQKYPLSPATLFFSMSIINDDEKYWGYLMEAIATVMKLDPDEFKKECLEITVYMQTNGAELVKELKATLMRTSMNGNGS